MLINNYKSLALGTAILMGSTITTAQAEGTVNTTFGLKTNHLWHGSIVTDGVMTAGSLSYTTEDNKTTYGFWGGGSFNGEFKEFTYYASHQFNDNWFVEAVNHGNHSSIDDSEVDIFNYSSDPTKTGNFTDIGVGYKFNSEMPISVYYSVIVQGIDKFIDDETGELERSFTNYMEVNADIWQGKLGDTVTAFIGGAFSPVQEKNFPICNRLNLT